MTGGMLAADQRLSFNAKGFLPQRVNAEITRRYTLNLKPISAGSDSAVFVATDRGGKGRTVCIKMVRVSDRKRKAACRKEAQIMKELDHPSICRLLETYEQGGFVVLVMEHCQGHAVIDRLVDQGKISEAVTADIVKQVASALKHAHSRGIAHRDIKPDNVCFCTDIVTDNHVKVIDWGLGFHFGRARMSSSVGTLTYCAPEVLEAQRLNGYTCACDFWSLGVMAYVMLCGKAPFWGSHDQQLKKMKAEQYPMWDSTWQGISVEAKDLIQGLLKADPVRRLPSNAVFTHPWLRKSEWTVGTQIASRVLKNMRRSSKNSQVVSIFTAAAARQSDHRSLQDVHMIFGEMDTNGDGVLELGEVKSGFERILGSNSELLREIEEVFARLDLDQSGTLDYTEFCAAAGERICAEEHTLWASFKAFDVNDDGHITEQEVAQVLQSTVASKAWTRRVCEGVSREVFNKFDKDGNGSLDYDEWLQLMRECASSLRDGNSTEDHKIDGELIAIKSGLQWQDVGISGFEEARDM